MDKRVYWLWLVMIFGPANEKLWKIGVRFDTVEQYYNALQDNSISEINDREKDRILKCSLEDAEHIIFSCAEKNIDVYCYESEGFPERLKAIANPPAVLFCRGNLDFLNNSTSIAVVGTRNPSEYSKKIASLLCEDLCKRGCLIVTGIANGIDQIANESAIQNNSPNYGICGREIDSDYPHGSEQLKGKISERGAIISETCSFLKSQSVSFSNRNRILIGLSDAVLFVECSADSRGLDNAKHAVSQGKYIFAAPPHDIFDKRYFGQISLIRQGCKPVFSGEDLIYYLSSTRVQDFSFDKIGGKYTDADDSNLFTHEELVNKPRRKIRKNKKTFENNTSEDISNNVKNNTIDYESLSETQAKICRLIEKNPTHADKIAVELEIDICDVLTELTILEIDGKIKSLPGKMFGV